jgi:hypothetical protein
MAKSSSGDEGYQEQPPPRRQPPPIRPDDEDEEYDDEVEHPRRSKSKDSVFSGVIPYRNTLALAAYYFGFVSLICILGTFALVLTFQSHKIMLLGFSLGGILALFAIVLGIMGLNYVSRYPRTKGTVHALIGLSMGILELFGLLFVFFWFAIIPG